MQLNQHNVEDENHVNNLEISSPTRLRTISAVFDSFHPEGPKKLPIKCFNHISKEVISVENSRRFYVDILGFNEISRPSFDTNGHWLFGYGLSIHIIESKDIESKQQLKEVRIERFRQFLPQVDHIAFMCDDISCIQSILDEYNVFYKFDTPCPGINQLFFFDPDGNVSQPVHTYSLMSLFNLKFCR